MDTYHTRFWRYFYIFLFERLDTHLLLKLDYLIIELWVEYCYSFLSTLHT